MHPISLVSDADSDDNTDLDGETHSQSKHHQRVHRGSMQQDLRDKIISSPADKQDLSDSTISSRANQNFVSVLGSFESLA